MKISDTRALIMMGFSAGSMCYSLDQAGDLIAQLRATLLDVADFGAMETISTYTRFINNKPQPKPLAGPMPP